jgi:hypothetical protein
MAGGIYVVIAFSFALAAGIVGRAKGSSFFIWFVIGGLVPLIGLAAAVLYRVESDEPRQRCPGCGRICMAYDALCVRCGTELELTDDTELLAPASHSK